MEAEVADCSPFNLPQSIPAFEADSEELEKAASKSVYQTAFNWGDSEDIHSLRILLESGYFNNYASKKFWGRLQDCHGIIFGFLFGFLLTFAVDHEWMIEEFFDDTEGHFVAKTFVVLFVFFTYSFIKLGFELILSCLIIFQFIYTTWGEKMSNKSASVLRILNKWKETLVIAITFLSPKICLQIFSVLWSLLLAFTGSRLWQWFWWNHICKSYHDRSCRDSWLGQLVIRNRNEICHDENTTDLFCERLLSYTPIILFAVFTGLVANILLPFINNLLSKPSSISTRLKAAFETMDRLKAESNGAADTEVATRSSWDDDPSPWRPLNGFESSAHLTFDKFVITSRRYGCSRVIPGLIGVAILFLLDFMIFKIMAG